MTTFTREDFEMAAKAVGFDSFDWLAADNRMNVYTPEGRQSSWNPITDDGDALRLAAKLGLTIHARPLTMSASQFGKVEYLGGWVDRTLDDEADYRACIFRAAIAIGRAMP